eukprot:3601178-Pyramimonas_sp.AAC.1
MVESVCSIDPCSPLQMECASEQSVRKILCGVREAPNNVQLSSCQTGRHPSRYHENSKQCLLTCNHSMCDGNTESFVITPDTFKRLLADTPFLLGRSRQLQKLPHHKVIGKDRTALIDLCFNHLDADGSGEIDIEELKVFAKIVNPRAQIQQAEMELQKMDANMDGTIK